MATRDNQSTMYLNLRSGPVAKQVPGVSGDSSPPIPSSTHVDSSKSDFEDFVRKGITDIKATLGGFEEALEFQGKRTTDLEKRMDPLEKKVAMLESKIEQHDQRLMQAVVAENRLERFSRRNNFCIVGLHQNANENPMEVTRISPQNLNLSFKVLFPIQLRALLHHEHPRNQETKKLVKERGWGGPGKAVISFTSTVNGYHHFKKRPFQGSQFLMQCRPEMGNKYDKAATLVVAPKLDVVAPELHDKETRAASTSGRDRQQTVREICGQPVGRVPKGLSAVVRFAITSGWGAYCWYLGTMTHDGPVRGGGPKLNVCYVMVGERRMTDEIVRQIRRNGGRDINVL